MWGIAIVNPQRRRNHPRRQIILDSERRAINGIRVERRHLTAIHRDGAKLSAVAPYLSK